MHALTILLAKVVAASTASPIVDAATLAWRLLLEPLQLTPWRLWMVIPVTIAVAVVYKTLKLQDLKTLPREAAMMTGQILAFLVLAGVGLWLLTELL